MHSSTGQSASPALERDRIVAGVLVAALHVALISALLTSRHESRLPQLYEPTLSLTRGAPIPPSILPSKLDLEAVRFADVRPPDIQIETQLRAPLPPRPDPAHENQSPNLPRDLAAAVRTPVVVLKVLVLPNGTIGGAIVSGTCGLSELDELARSFVTANWRFLPAVEKGQLVADWISVEVSFSESPS